MCATESVGSSACASVFAWLILMEKLWKWILQDSRVLSSFSICVFFYSSACSLSQFSLGTLIAEGNFTSPIRVPILTTRATAICMTQSKMQSPKVQICPRVETVCVITLVTLVKSLQIDLPRAKGEDWADVLATCEQKKVGKGVCNGGNSAVSILQSNHKGWGRERRGW